ncbi:hypothetical protein AHAS_Ahas06G0133600 [Arachis hypogaea]
MTLAIYDGSGVFEASSSNSAGEQESSPSGLAWIVVDTLKCRTSTCKKLFAVGNYINQRLLAPFHDWLATCLRRIPMDGTYDQLSPLDRLKGSTGVICSVDLKAATDRWPLLLLFELTQVLFGRSLASSAVNSALATNIFQVAFVKKRTLVSFIAGQPLGYRSSWPLFALSHHLVVWVAAEQEYPGKVFKKYAVLGDDVVIADPKVASRYETLVQRLGVKVSAAKSIRSPVGACEFAKRFRVDNLTVDLSPVSCAASRPIGCPTHGKRGRRLLVMLLMFYTKCFSLETSLSIVLGRPIPPQCVGALVHALLEHFAPKELKVPPIEVFAYPGMAEFNEYSVMQGWMRQYLSYLKWYSLLYTRPVSLGDFFEAPVYTDTWFSKSIDPDVFRFGVAFRVVDMATRACNKPSLLLPVVEEPPIVDSLSSFAEMPFQKIFSRIGTRPTILDLANSGADGDSPIDSTDSDLDAPAHKHMDRDADSDAARKARLSDS